MNELQNLRFGSSITVEQPSNVEFLDSSFAFCTIFVLSKAGMTSFEPGTSFITSKKPSDFAFLDSIFACCAIFMLSKGPLFFPSELPSLQRTVVKGGHHQGTCVSAGVLVADRPHAFLAGQF
jgi:hypothetical protein